MYAWRTDDGLWLVINEQHLHTGHRVDINFSPDINNATVCGHLSFEVRRNYPKLTPVPVTVRRIVWELPRGEGK